MMICRLSPIIRKQRSVNIKLNKDAERTYFWNPDVWGKCKFLKEEIKLFKIEGQYMLLCIAVKQVQCCGSIVYDFDRIRIRIGLSKSPCQVREPDPVLCKLCDNCYF
jgi:hypothetical protein